MFAACVQATVTLSVFSLFGIYLFLSLQILRMIPSKSVAFVCSQLRAPEWMEGDDFNTQAVMNICGEFGPS